MSKKDQNPLGTDSYAALAGAGTIFDVMGIQQEADDKANAAREKAYLKDLQADEVWQNAGINVQSAEEEGARLIGSQQAGYAKGGVQVGGGTPLMTMEATHADINRKIFGIREDANYRAEVDLTQAQFDRSEASNIQAAAGTQEMGSILTAGASIAMAVM